MTFSLERASGRGSATVRIWTLIGLVLVPLLVVGGLVAATLGQGARLGQKQAAIVNLDEPVEVNGQPTPIGRELAAKLTAGTGDGGNYEWVLASAEDADAGVDSGKYAAVVTIPKNFSKAATSLQNPDEARQATIEVRASQNAGLGEQSVVDDLVTAARNAMSRTLTQTYLENIYVGFNTIHEQMGTVGQGADKLAKGSDQLAKGLTQAQPAIGKLNEGMQLLSTNGTKLTEAGTKLGEGGKLISDGAGKVQTQIPKLREGVKVLDQSGPDIVRGVQGLEQLTALSETGTKDFVGAVRQNSAQLTALADTVSTVSNGVGDAASHAPGTPGAPSVTPVPTGKPGEKGAYGPVARAADQLDSELQRLTGTIRDIQKSKAVQCPYREAEKCEIWNQAVKTTSDQSVEALTKAQGDAKASVLAASSALVQAVDRLEQGGVRLDPQGPPVQLPDGTAIPAQDLSKLVAQARGISKAAQDFKTGVQGIDQNGDKLISDAEKVHQNTSAMSKQLTTALNGPKPLKDQLNGYVDQLEQATTLGQKFGEGVVQYTKGVDAYVDGVGKAAKGTEQLNAEFPKIVQGADALAKGNKQLADGVKSGAKQIPTYDAAQRVNLKNAVADPITITDPGAKVSEAAQATTLLQMLALWLGSTAIFVVARAIPRRALTTTESTGRLLLGTLGPAAALGAVQALAVGVVGQVVMGLTFSTMMAVLAVLLLATLVFVVINHALAAWLNNAGRVIALLVLVLSGGLGLSSAVPGWFSALGMLSPITPAVQAMRGLLFGSSITGPVVALVGWLVVGLVLSAAAMARARSADPRRFAKEQFG